MSLYVPYRMQTFLVKGQEMSHVDRIISHERSHCTCTVRLNKTAISMAQTCHPISVDVM
jgi:hypothetical protein